jgi:hypothetical protein
MDGVEVILVKDPVGFERIFEGGIAEQNRNLLVFLVDPGSRRGTHLGALGGEDDPLLHHPEILVALGVCFQGFVDLNIVKPGSLEEIPELFGGVETLRIELIRYHPFLDMGDDLPGYEALSILREGALPANKVLFVNPLPGARQKVLPKILPIAHINQKPPSRFEDTIQLPQDPEIILNGLKIAKTIPQKESIIKAVLRIGKFAGVSLAENNRKPLGFRLPPGSRNKVAGAVEPLRVEKPPAKKLKDMPPLPTAEIEDPIAGFGL